MISRRLAALAAGLMCAYAAHAQDNIPALPLGATPDAFTLMSAGAGKIIDTSDGSVLSEEDLALAIAQADVIVVGERHANVEVHAFQAKLISALGSVGRHVIVGMEFFEPEDDAALEDYIMRRTTLDEMVVATRWYDDGGYNFAYYRPIIRAAYEDALPVRGLNAPRALIRKISRDGMEALSDIERERFLEGETPRGDAHTYLINRMMGDAGVGMPSMLERILRGQSAWDAVMSASILRALDGAEGTAGVLAIVGSGHMAHGLGIPAWLARERPDLNIVTIGPVMAETPDPDAPSHPGMAPTASAVFSKGYADYVYVLHDDQGRQTYPRPGIRFDPEADNGAIVRSVTPGSIAERGGILAGDRLLTIDQRDCSNADDARLALAKFRFGMRVEFRLVRNGEELTLPVILAAPTDGPFDWLESEPASALLDRLDPGAERPVVEEITTPADRTHARLVRRDGNPERIDVFRRGLLSEVWRLDDLGRVSSAVFAEPADDGAVSLSLRWDEHGKIVSHRRVDARGRVIDDRFSPDD